MRAWTKWLGVATFGLLASNAVAADHGDGPAVSATAATDITDIYSWMTPDNQKLILIMDVAGEFSTNHLYAFHISRQDSAINSMLNTPSDETLVICQFESTTNIQCWAGTDYVTGDPSPDAGITSTSGNIKVHAGEHADPFFMYISGFATARLEVVNLANASVFVDDPNTPQNEGFDANGCPGTFQNHPDAGTNDLPLINSTIASALVDQLTGVYDADWNAIAGGAVDDFDGTDVWSIVLEVDKSLIGGTGDYFQVWGSTNSPM